MSFRSSLKALFSKIQKCSEILRCPSLKTIKRYLSNIWDLPILIKEHLWNFPIFSERVTCGCWLTWDGMTHKQIDRIEMWNLSGPTMAKYLLFYFSKISLCTLKNPSILDMWMTLLCVLKMKLKCSISHLIYCTCCCISHMKRRTMMFFLFLMPWYTDQIPDFWYQCTRPSGIPSGLNSIKLTWIKSWFINC